MSNEIINNNSLDILNSDDLDKLEVYKDLIDEIVEESETILESYFSIGRNLNQIKEEKLYELENYGDVYELALDKFKFKETSVKNMISVYLKYKNDNDCLDNKFNDFTYTSLVELLPVDNEKIITDYKSNMTVKEIRESKKISQLTDFMQTRIKLFEKFINHLQLKIDVFNKSVDKKSKLELIKYRCNLNIFEFEYEYLIKNNKGYYDLNYKNLSLLSNGIIKWRYDVIIDEDNFEEKLLMFDKLFDQYKEYLLNDCKDEKKEIIIKTVEEKTLNYLSFYANLKLEYVYDIFKFIKTVLLKDLDNESYESEYNIHIKYYYFQPKKDNSFSVSRVNEVERIEMPLYDIEKNVLGYLKFNNLSKSLHLSFVNRLAVKCDNFININNKISLLNFFKDILDLYNYK